MNPDPDNVVKFGRLEGSETLVHQYGDVWTKEEYPTWSRLVIGPSSDHIAHIVSLLDVVSPPYGVLWVLLVSRAGHEVGRYQSPMFHSRDEVVDLLFRYRDFFEQDGRHHLWVANTEGHGQIIYDNHNLIYAYGPLNEFERVLRDRGLASGDVEIPVPHSHGYDRRHDESESELMSGYEWTWIPLVEERDDP